MKRRGVLGFLLGGAVAGPGMVKSAAVSSMAELDLRSMGVSGLIPEDNPIPAVPYKQNFRGMLAKLIGRTPEQHKFYRDRTAVYGLDADLASYRSFSLGTKIRLQRERTYEEARRMQQGWFEANLAGWMDD